jgi:cytoskeleton protein RodZ
VNQAIAEQIDIALTLGQLLRNARKEQDLSQEDVADHLRLSPSVLERIESDAYLSEGLTVFMRGYIRAYAKLVNIASTKIDTFFADMGVLNKTNKVKPVKFTFRDAHAKQRSMRWITSAIIVVLLLLVVLWAVWHHNSNKNLVASTNQLLLANNQISAVQTSNSRHLA